MGFLSNPLKLVIKRHVTNEKGEVKSSKVRLRHVWERRARVERVGKLFLFGSTFFSLRCCEERSVLTQKERKKERNNKKKKMEKSGGRKVMDEIRSFEKASLFDLGHPLLNRVADSFVKAAAVSSKFSDIRDNIC